MIPRVVALALALAPRATLAEPATWRLTREMAVGEGAMAVALLGGQGVAVGCPAPMHRTLDGGRNWSPSFQRERCGYGVEMAPGLAVNAGNQGLVLRSTDGGVHWSQAGTLGQDLVPHHPRHLSFLDADRGLLASDLVLGLTLDGARTFRRLTPPPSQASFAAVSLGAQGGALVLRALDEAGALWRSDDEGRTWTAAPSPLRGRVVESVRGPVAALRFRGAEGVLVAVLDDGDRGTGHVYRTRDGGATWVEERIEPGFGTAVVTLGFDGTTLVVLDVNSATARVFEPGGAP